MYLSKNHNAVLIHQHKTSHPLKYNADNKITISIEYSYSFKYTHFGNILTRKKNEFKLRSPCTPAFPLSACFPVCPNVPC